MRFDVQAAGVGTGFPPPRVVRRVAESAMRRCHGWSKLMTRPSMPSQFNRLSQS